MPATVPSPADSDPDRLSGVRPAWMPPLPYEWGGAGFTRLLDEEAARRGLAPEPWEDPWRLRGPRITPLFTRLLEEEAARRGLPPEPWTA